jgi:hypothetical protein
MATKKLQILALDREGKTPRDIAIIVYGLDSGLSARDIDRKAAYVRVVVRQRKGSGLSAFDRAYRKTDAAKISHRKRMRRWQKRRYETEPAFREAKRAVMRACRERRRVAPS